MGSDTLFIIIHISVIKYKNLQSKKIYVFTEKKVSC